MSHWKTLTPKFSIGDHVRITKKRKYLIKDTLNDRLKRILQFLKLTIPVTYKITDYNGDEIQGSFYEQDFKRRSKTYLG